MNAKTLIYDEDNNLYMYEDRLHDDNHHAHIESNCKNLRITEYIPILLVKSGSCVLDITESRHLCEVYLPLMITLNQKKWLLMKEDYLKDFHLGIYSIRSETETCLKDWQTFESLKSEIESKKIKEKKI
ncbi:MAG TPA: hypothetical protein IAB56_01085 [Candidatus Scybalousia intestinigallinarum]|nr:hypothetical protein [Candidatus Scybalousia intestinigallinarum]